MISKKSPIVNIHSTLVELNQGRMNPTIERLYQAHVHTIEDLLWIIPLHWHPIPRIEKFIQATAGSYFKGEGTIIDRGFYRLKQKAGANLCHLQEAFRIVHGIAPKPAHLNTTGLTMAKRRLIYHEFYLEQVKINTHRQKHKKSRHLSSIFQTVC